MEKNQLVFNNELGTITNRNVIFNFKDGTVDIPVDEIISLSFERRQNRPAAFIYFAFCFALLVTISTMSNVNGCIISVSLLLIVLCTAIGSAYYIGNYFIKIEIRGKGLLSMKVELAQTKKGKEFTEALSEQIKHSRCLK